jgi:hypothetical protein
MVADSISSGDNLSNVWRQIWQEFTRDALLSLFKVKHSASALGTLLGGIGGKGGKGGGSSSGSANPFLKYFPTRNAIGSIDDKETLTWIREGNKKEAVIPLEEHKDRGLALWMQAGRELGVKGMSVMPFLKNENLANSDNINVNVRQTQEHLAKLDLQNNLLAQQNQMIANMAASGNGNITVISTQMSDQQILEAISRNPGVLTSILSSARNKGFR